MLAARLGHGLVQFVDTLIQVNFFKRLVHRLGTHLRDKSAALIKAVIRPVGFDGLAHLRLSQELIAFQRRVSGINHKIILVVNYTLKVTAGHVQHQTET